MASCDNLEFMIVSLMLLSLLSPFLLPNLVSPRRNVRLFWGAGRLGEGEEVFRLRNRKVPEMFKKEHRSQHNWNRMILWKRDKAQDENTERPFQIKRFHTETESYWRVLSTGMNCSELL